MSKKLEENGEQLTKTKKLLDEKEDDLKAHRADSKRRLADVYEMKYVYECLRLSVQISNYLMEVQISKYKMEVYIY